MQETINNIRKIVKNKGWTFPYYVQLLKNIGVIKYTVDMKTYNTTYYFKDGSSYIEQINKYYDIGETFDQDAVVRSLNAYQWWYIDTDTRLTQSRLAWVKTYEINIINMQMTYSGNWGSYSQSIPTVTL